MLKPTGPSTALAEFSPSQGLRLALTEPRSPGFHQDRPSNFGLLWYSAHGARDARHELVASRRRQPATQSLISPAVRIYRSNARSNRLCVVRASRIGAPHTPGLSRREG